MMHPEEQDLNRLEAEQAKLGEQVTSAELTLGISKIAAAHFNIAMAANRVYAKCSAGWLR